MRNNRKETNEKKQKNVRERIKSRLELYRERIMVLKKSHTVNGIQSTLMISFSALSLAIVVILGSLFMFRFRTSVRTTALSSTEAILQQTGTSLDENLLMARRISDTADYEVLSGNSLTDPFVAKNLYLLYEANKDAILSIALYDTSGSLLLAEPVAKQKEDPDVSHQEWFQGALDKPESFYVSAPHVQNLFQDDSSRYNWTVSMSRVIYLTEGDRPKKAILLVDLDYSRLERTMKKINENAGGQYYYICDDKGNLIYHPRQVPILEGYEKEPSALFAIRHEDGSFPKASLKGRDYISIRSITYTGWKLVSVIPGKTLTQNMINNVWFLFFILSMTSATVLLINRIAAIRIARPILALDESVKSIEAGKLDGQTIYIGGSPEIRHLGDSIQKSYEEIDRLMHQIVEEERLRQKSEMDALQSQINPHFLYNTLDSITWMIEGEKNEEAVYMITQLARLFRISLSKGNRIISIGDEVLHAQSYMNIQKYRYKDRFQVQFHLPEEIKTYCTVKLILQPILENAIYYGVETMDGDGLIEVSGEISGKDIYIHVKDNGIGMTEETVKGLLTGGEKTPRHGSGVGLKNVNNRIRLQFGEAYGLIIQSEPDEGTKVTLHLPAIPFTEENRKRLEEGQ